MSNQYYPGAGGRGGGGYGMRGRGMGPGGGHQMGMMGHPGQGRGGGMMMGDRGDPQRGWGFDTDPHARDPGMDRGYDRGGYDMGMGDPQMGGPNRGPMPPAGRGASSGLPPIMDEPVRQSRIHPSNKPSNAPVVNLVRYANDCEIIVTAKAQQQYAEMIEKEIKDCQLKVDLMFPKPDVKLANFIDNIAAMGTIFAVVIRPDNENHRSVSVHVLRGPPKPEEHRNMPLTAAYQLIKERYYELKRKEIGIIPDNIKTIIKFLLDERQLTEHEYATVIRFLQDRLRKQNSFEKRTNNKVGEDNISEIIDTPEAEDLQQRILAAMAMIKQEPESKVVEGERVGDLVVPRPKQPLGSLDSDPTVQNAINTLMNPSFLSVLNSATNNGQGGSSMGRGGGGGGQAQGFGRGGGF